MRGSTEYLKMISLHRRPVYITKPALISVRLDLMHNSHRSAAQKNIKFQRHLL